MVTVVNIPWRDFQVDVFFNDKVDRFDADWMQVGDLKIPMRIFCHRRSWSQFRMPGDTIVKKAGNVILFSSGRCGGHYPRSFNFQDCCCC